MKIIENINEIKHIIKSYKIDQKKIGFVPTMGYLHKGHMSLVKASVEENDITVLSIFVNPIQFGANEDLDSYPKNLEGDFAMARDAGVDIVFVPKVIEMYPAGFNSYVNVEEITDVLCGKSRPGHFKGVTTVVTKLFNIVEPDTAYFGQKDAQQVAVIKKMVRDLNMNVNINVCPIIRENDGLAMSSRNSYLNDKERKAALVLYRSLTHAKGLINEGQKDKNVIVQSMKEMINIEPLACIDYIELMDFNTLKEIEVAEGMVLIAVAVKIGTTRLIDNVIVEV